MTVGQAPTFNNKSKCFLGLSDKEIKDGVLVDELGNEYHLNWDVAAKELLIYSVGPNGIDEQGGGDDISNWGGRTLR